MYTVEQCIRNDILPSTDILSESEYKQIFKELNIPFEEGNFKNQKLDDASLDKLLYNSKINKALMTQKAKSLNAGVILGYNSLINEEQEMINKANGKYETSYMKEVVDALTAERDKHQAIDDSFTYSNVNDMLNGLQQSRLESVNNRMEKNDSKLKVEYDKLAKLDETMKSARTNFKKRRTERRMAKVIKRLQKLREKQGRLIGVQRQIVGEAAEKYTKHRQKEMDKYNKSIVKDKKYANKVNDINTRLQAAKEDLKLTQNELNGIKDKNVQNKFRRSLERDERKLTSEVERLEKRQNRINASRERYEKRKEMEKLRKTATLAQRIQSLRGKVGSFGPREEAVVMSM